METWGRHTWNADARSLIAELSAALKREALPFLSRVQSPLDVASVAASLDKPGDPYVQQTIAYAFARAGDVQRAAIALSQLARILDVKDQYPWQQEMADRAEALVVELQDNPAAAQRRLESWQAKTTRMVGLVKSP